MQSPFPAPSRRQFLKLSGAALAVPLLGPRAFAGAPTEMPLHGLSAFGDLKYPEDFQHFDYASPEAPEGGTFNFQPGNWVFNQNVLTFNTMNSFVRTGDAPPRMELCFDSLMTGALDEPDAIYGVLAETVTLSQDRNTLTFALRPEARFHDGTPLTAEDVAFSYHLLKERGHPQLSLPLVELVEAKAADARTLQLVFSGRQTERAVLTVLTFPVFSKASLEGERFDSSEIAPLLGSGPWKVGRYSAGSFIEYDRVEDYWARDLPPRRGLNHFARLRIEFFRDRTAAFEAFKAGQVLWRQEFTSRIWANDYDFPARREDRVLLREFPGEKRPDLQAWALNQRRARFRDRRVRQAIGLCFDFEWTNRNIFYGLYERSHSYFESSDFKTTGTPSDEELALLERFRGKIPEEAFGEAVMQPVSDGSGRDRSKLAEARRLFNEAGWQIEGNVLRNEDGEPFRLEYIVTDEVFVRASMPFIQSLRAVGVDASIRVLDASQYQSRMASFDFDMIGSRFAFTATPSADGLELVFHSRTAEVEGSRNLPGTADDVIDEIIALAGNATSREELTVALKALDRVLRARYEWIPLYHSGYHRVAYWDMFGFKEPKPDYGFPVETLWWYDEDRARAIGRA